MSLNNVHDRGKTRIIFHIDFDYFYAQCEELRDPSLKGKPIVVCVFSARGGDSGAVATSNYKAREYGVKSGIPIKLAKNRLKDVPEAKFLPMDRDYYEEVSERAMQVIRKYGDKFELVGIDEGFIEVTGRAKEFAMELKQELKKEVGLSCSIGMGPNKLVAKIASDFQKPDGLTLVKPEEVKSFLADLSVSKILGVGKKTEESLNEMGAKTIDQLSSIDIYTLTKRFGKKIGTYLYNAARGIDEEPVVESESATQLSRITTLKKSTIKVEEMLEDLESLCKNVYSSAIEQGFSFRSIGIMLILDDLSIKSKSRSLKSHTNNADELFKVANTLLEEAVAESQIPVRRLGVKVSELATSKGQDTLSRFMTGES
jgi:DNA polymerase IV (DinB-like DNA polymerase)